MWLTLRGQTGHWIGTQFCVCVFLDSKDKYSNLLKFYRNKKNNKIKNKKNVLVADSAYNSQNTQHNLNWKWKNDQKLKATENSNRFNPMVFYNFTELTDNYGISGKLSLFY